MKKYMWPIGIFLIIICVSVIFASGYIIAKYFSIGFFSDSDNNQAGLDDYGAGMQASSTDMNGNGSTSVVGGGVSDPGLPFTYTSEHYGFSIDLPSAPVNTTALPKTKETTFTVNDQHRYVLGRNLEIPGVRFTIPTSIATGTNLSSDTYISIELLSNNVTSKSCIAEAYLFGFDEKKPGGLYENETPPSDRVYSIATSSGAGAGNRYEESLFAFTSGNACYGIRYMVHYTVLENYPAGTRVEFDKPALYNLFDRLRKTVRVL